MLRGVAAAGVIFADDEPLGASSGANEATAATASDEASTSVATLRPASGAAFRAAFVYATATSVLGRLEGADGVGTYSLVFDDGTSYDARVAGPEVRDLPRDLPRGPFLQR